MADEKILEAVKKGLEEGKTTNDIKEDLAGQGFEEEHILEALTEAMGDVGNKKSKDDSPDKVDDDASSEVVPDAPKEEPKEPAVDPEVEKTNGEEVKEVPGEPSKDIDEAPNEPIEKASMETPEASNPKDAETPKPEPIKEPEPSVESKENEEKQAIANLPPEGSEASDETPKEKGSSRPRPLILTIIAIIGMLLTLLGIVGGVALLGIQGLEAVSGLSGGTFFSSTLGFGDFITGLLYLVINAVGFFGCFMLFRMKKIGWIITFAISIVSLIILLSPLMFSFMLITMVFTLPISTVWILIVLYLFLKKNLFFGEDIPQPVPGTDTPEQKPEVTETPQE